MEKEAGETYVGLDVHKEIVVATALDSQGRTVSEARFPSDDAELIRYLASLPGTKHVVLEACSIWEHFYEAAVSTGVDVTVAHPYKTRVISEASLKSDRVDSFALANLLRLGSVPKAYVADPEVRALRQVIRNRGFYRRKSIAVQNHIYSILLLKGIRYETGILAFKRRREQLREHRIPEVDRSLDFLIAAECATKELDDTIHEAYLKSREAQLLGSIPGVGEFTAVALVAFLCPVDRFAGINQISSYAGLAPTNSQSGGRSYHGRLKMDCNPLLRWVLVEAGWAHRRYGKGSDICKAAKRASRRGGPGKGSIAAAHKLLKVVYAVLHRGTPYLDQAPERPSCKRLIATS